MKPHGDGPPKGASIRSLRGSIAILALVAGIALAAAPVLDHRGNSAAAAQGGVTVSAVILAPGTTYLPPTYLAASAQGYVATASWTNPVSAYSGTLIEWYPDHAHQGTSQDATWAQYETFYPPASWARISAPLGARYTIRASAFYDGEATRSAPITCSVVLTTPVDAAAPAISAGYAASAALRKHYGSARYLRTFTTQLSVPGGAANLAMSPNPITWSPQLVGDPGMDVYRQIAKVTVNPKTKRRTTVYSWSSVFSQQPSGTLRSDGTIVNTRAAFVDGYPSVCSYPFSSTVPGTYKLVMTGVLAEGFAYNDAQTWTMARYLTLKPTGLKTTLSLPKTAGAAKTTKKVAFSGTIAPRRVTTVKLSALRAVGKKWQPYATVSVKTKRTGAWKTSIRLGAKGTYRVSSSTASTIVSAYREYLPASSRIRTVKVN